MQTGDRNCNWQEDPVDPWDWAIVTSEGTCVFLFIVYLLLENDSGPAARLGHFLFESHDGGTQDEGSTARIHSPLYQNSREACSLR